MKTRQRLAALALTLVCAARAHAQEAINTPAATMPAKDTFMARWQLMFQRFSDEASGVDFEGEEYFSHMMLSYGVAPGWALDLRLPIVSRSLDFDDGGDEHDFGISDPALLLRWRFHRSDTGPIDTARAVLVAGAELPVGDDEVSSDSVDAMLGAVYTQIRARHGISAALQWKNNQGSDDGSLTGGDGPSDAFRYDGAYLYRTSPATFAEQSLRAHYAVLELNGLYEANGDHELLVGPGYLYEASTWALEVGFQVPVIDDLDRRPSTSVMLNVGVRYLF